MTALSTLQKCVVCLSVLLQDKKRAWGNLSFCFLTFVLRDEELSHSIWFLGDDVCKETMKTQTYFTAAVTMTERLVCFGLLNMYENRILKHVLI